MRGEQEPVALEVFFEADRVPVELVEDGDGRWTALATDPGSSRWLALYLREMGSVVLEGDVVDCSYELNVQVVGEEPVTAAVRVSRGLDAAQPWWLIPGLFYGRNRPADSTRLFPSYGAGVEDAAQMVSSHWSFRSDRAATPAVLAWGSARGTGLLTTETSEVGPTGLGFQGPDCAGGTRVHLDFPYREEPLTYYGSATPLPPVATFHRFEGGTETILKFRSVDLPANRHSYAPLLRREWGENGEEASPGWMGPKRAADLCSQALYTWHYQDDPPVLVETAGFDREIKVDGNPVDRHAMHVGWISGIPWCYALLRNGLRTENQDHISAAINVMDFIAGNLSPSGTFWGTWYRERGWAQSWTPIKDGLHGRTLGEATLFLIRALVAIRDVGLDRPQWEAAIKSNLDAIAGRQRQDGNLGAIHHSHTREVLQWEGAAGLAWIPAFVEASGAGLGNYRDAAVAAGTYYEQYVEREFIHGAVEDVDLAPTSEDGYCAVMAYMSLHRATGEEHWLNLARRSADWMLTFRYTYNVAFDAETLLGTYGFRSRGADQASPSNQHLHNYGLICTREMLELSAASGDDYYARRALESEACFRQFIARRDGDFNAYQGMVTERYYQTECFQPKGMILTLSHAWCLGVNILANEDIIARGQL